MGLGFLFPFPIHTLSIPIPAAFVWKNENPNCDVDIQLARNKCGITSTARVKIGDFKIGHDRSKWLTLIKLGVPNT